MKLAIIFLLLLVIALMTKRRAPAMLPNVEPEIEDWLDEWDPRVPGYGW